MANKLWHCPFCKTTFHWWGRESVDGLSWHLLDKHEAQLTERGKGN